MQAAALYARVGAFDKYCDAMVEMGDWVSALAHAPAVSQGYWRSLMARYAQHLAEKGNAAAVRVCLWFYTCMCACVSGVADVNCL